MPRNLARFPIAIVNERSIKSGSCSGIERERQSGNVEDYLHVNDVGRDGRILINAEREGS